MSKPPAAKPLGLWRKARGSSAPRLATPDRNPPPPPPQDRDNIDESERTRYCSDSSSGSSRKRRRLSHSPSSSSDEEIHYWDYSRRCSPHPERLNKWTTRSKLMDTSSAAGAGQPSPDRLSCDLEDWEDLKELFAKAAEMYETQEAGETMPLLRGVIHECHRFLQFYDDPSVLFTPQPTAPDAASPSARSPSQEYVRNWTQGSNPPIRRSQGTSPGPLSGPAPPKPSGGSSTAQNTEKEKKCKCVDLPTAFHTLLGTTLFLFGNFMGQDPSLALEGEPNGPVPYWLAALDVFETGDSLPIRTSGRGVTPGPEDWRMAVVWGRTLVSIAGEVLNRRKEGNLPTPAPPSSFHLGGVPGLFATPPVEYPADHPEWPSNSPFAIIAASRPPVSSRLSLATASPHELMLQAQDHFTRGMFHMPHSQHGRRRRHLLPPMMGASSAGAPSSSSSQPPPSTIHLQPISSSSTSTPTPSVTVPSAATSSTPAQSAGTFSRIKELFTIATEVLVVAEKLTETDERAQWASWAETLFSQMKMELSLSHPPDAAPAEVWKGVLALNRGRCCLITGSARAEELEERLEEGDMDVLREEKAEDARDVLKAAIEFFDAAKEVYEERRERKVKDTKKSEDKGKAVAVQDEHDEDAMQHSDHEENGGEDEDEDMQELKPLLTEALITLANLTPDPKEREDLYARAQKEGGDSFQLDDEDRMVED